MNTPMSVLCVNRSVYVSTAGSFVAFVKDVYSGLALIKVVRGADVCAVTVLHHLRSIELHHDRYYKGQIHSPRHPSGRQKLKDEEDDVWRGHSLISR